MGGFTSKYAIDETQRLPEDHNSANKLYLLVDTTFSGKNDEYTLIAGKMIGEGGEAVVYQAIRKSDNKIFAAKIYTQNADEPATRRVRKSVLKLIELNSNFHKSHILPIIDYGTIEIELDDDEPYRKPVDIMPLCTQGNLLSRGNIDFKTLKNKVIPNINTALKLMHKENLVHRDIKPANIYWYENEIALSDFGTTCEVNTTGVIGTKTSRGSLGYMSPEVASGYAMLSSDYYSLGCTIASLYKGSHVYKNLVDKGNRYQVNMLMSREGLPLTCQKGEESLQTLVDALIINNEDERANCDDVELWLKDSQQFKAKFKGRSRLARETFTFKFENENFYNIEDLTEVLIANWRTAKDYLYRGGIQNSTLVNLLSKVNQTLAIKAGRIIEDKVTALNHNLGISMFLTLLNNKGFLIWKGKRYSKLSEISKEIHNNYEGIYEDMIEMLNSKFLSWGIKSLIKNNDADLADIKKVLEDIEELVDEYPSLAIYYFMYKFAPDDSYLNYNNTQNADELFEFLISDNEKFYDRSQDVFDDYKFFAFLSYLGFAQNVVVVLNEANNKLLDNLELLYRLFEAVCINKESVRQHYEDKGPKSYLKWIKDHLHLYSFNSPLSKNLKKDILDANINSLMEINEQSRIFNKLGEYYKDFLDSFQNNIVLAYMGINCEKDKLGITSDSSDAFFLADFYGKKVPLGFMKDLRPQSKSIKKENQLES